MFTRSVAEAGSAKRGAAFVTGHAISAAKETFVERRFTAFGQKAALRLRTDFSVSCQYSGGEALNCISSRLAAIMQTAGTSLR